MAASEISHALCRASTGGNTAINTTARAAPAGQPGPAATGHPAIVFYPTVLPGAHVMTVVHISPTLQRRPWGHTWQMVALSYRVRDYAAVMEAVCALDSDNLAIERDDWMIVAQGVSQKQAALVALFLSHPEDMEFCDQDQQITISPIQDLRSTARCLRQIAPNSSRAMVGRLILDLADQSTLTMLQVTLSNPLDITAPRRHPVLLDVA